MNAGAQSTSSALPVDDVTREIAEYVANYQVKDEAALDAAHLCLIDTLGCGFEGLSNAECRKFLGPLFPLGETGRGARVPGTALDIDPITAAFDIGCASRWVDFSETYFGAQGSHPSDNIGGILAVSDYISRRNRAAGAAPLSAREVLEAIIKAYEIQGVLSIENSFYDAGLDHVLLVKLATAAVATKLLGGGIGQIESAVSNAWVDGHSLSTYRRSPNAGTRKSWAGADATAKGLFLAALAMRGEMTYSTALTAKTWGLYDVLFEGKPLAVPRPYGASIVKEIQFKVQVPTVFNSQTAAECAIQLHPLVRDRLGHVKRIVISAHETTIRLNAKTGPLTTPGDRDHCVQFIVAAGLARGRLTAEDYEGARASDSEIESLRRLTEVVEDKRYTASYRDLEKRASANAVQVWFDDGSSTPKVEVEYPLGHPRRRPEAMPLLMKKFTDNVARVFPKERQKQILDKMASRAAMERMAVDEIMILVAL